MKQKIFTISQPVVIPKPVSWNISIVLSRKGCIDILRSRTPSSIYWCCQIRSKDTMHPTTTLLACMTPNQVNFKNEKDVWDHMYGKRLSKKTQKGSFKVKDSVRLNRKLLQFYLPGWAKKNLLWNMSYLVWFLLKRLSRRNFGQGYLSQTRFIKSERVKWWFIPSGQDHEAWLVGKVSEINTTVGLTRRTWKAFEDECRVLHYLT